MCILGKEVNTDRLIDKLAVRAQYLCSKLNLIQKYWSNRFSDENLIPHIFGTMVTGILDVAAMARYKSVARAVKKRSYSGKYKDHVMKLQIVCDLRGRVIWLSGPHPGSDHDGQIWKYQNPIEDMHRTESFLADKAYIGQPAITCQFKRSRNKDLSPFKKCWNAIHGYYRVTVEHSIGYARVFGFLRQKHRSHIGISPKSITRYQIFTRLIFEICNLHFDLQGTQRRTLQPVFVNLNGDNVLPRMDDCEERRLLRKRLHKQQGKFFNANMILRKSHLNTGYEPSNFDDRDKVWFIRIESKKIVHGHIWAISRNKDNAQEPYFSVRTSTGAYEAHLLAKYMIPFDKKDKPLIVDFVLTKTSIFDEDFKQGRSQSCKDIWKRIKNDTKANNKALFNEATKEYRTRTTKAAFSMDRETNNIMDDAEWNEEPSDADFAYEESISDESYDESSSDSEDVEECDRDESDDETDLVKNYLRAQKNKSVRKASHAKSISKADQNQYVRNSPPQPTSGDDHKSNKKKCNDAIMIDDSTVELGATQSQFGYLQFISFVKDKSWAETGTAPLIPCNVVNIFCNMEQCIFASFLLLSSIKFQSLLNIFSHPVNYDSYYGSMHILLNLKNMMDMNIVTREVDIANLHAALQMTRPETFYAFNRDLPQNFNKIFTEVIKAIFFEEDTFFDNAYHSVNQMSTISIRFGVHTQLVMQDETVVNPVDLSHSNIEIHDNRLSDMPPFNILIYIDRSNSDYMKRSGKFNIGPITFDKFPENRYFPVSCVCEVYGSIAFVNLAEKYAVFVNPTNDTRTMKCQFDDFCDIPIQAGNHHLPPKFDATSTCMLILTELENFECKLFKALDPFSNKIYLQTDSTYSPSQSREIDLGSLPVSSSDRKMVYEQLLTVEAAPIQDFIVGDCIGYLLNFVPGPGYCS